MSKTRAKALRAEVNQVTADYVDAAIDASLENLKSENHRLSGRIEELQARVTNLENLEANKDEGPIPDDKYALTKRKLVNLLNRLGID